MKNMKKLFAVLLCAVLLPSPLCAEKFLATINEHAGYSIDNIKGAVNYQTDVFRSTHRGYVVPLTVETILEIDTTMELDDVIIMFNDEQKVGSRWICDYSTQMGGWDGGTHSARFGNSGDAWGKGLHDFRIIKGSAVTYRVHNDVPNQDFKMYEFNGTQWGYRLGVHFSWAYAKSKRARKNLNELPYMSFSTWDNRMDIHTVRIMSFVQG